MRLEDLAARLRSADGSVRMQAAMAAGTSADPAAIDLLVERCGVDADFFVRDMLTWALTRTPAETTVPRLVAELSSPFPQARTQALHTLSKIGDPSARPAITAALLHDEEDQVARAAWRAAVVLVDAGGEAELATDLATELGRRTRECRQSLTRALLGLGEASRVPLERTATTAAFAARVHAGATLLLLDGLQRDFGAAVEVAQQEALGAGGRAAAS